MLRGIVSSMNVYTASEHECFRDQVHCKHVEVKDKSRSGDSQADGPAGHCIEVSCL